MDKDNDGLDPVELMEFIHGNQEVQSAELVVAGVYLATLRVLLVGGWLWVVGCGLWVVGC